jgi:uncharacterized protein (DUF3084 family)
MITEKKLLIQQQLNSIVQEHNQLVEKKKELFNKVIELQGALKVLQELDDERTNTTSDTEPSEGS